MSLPPRDLLRIATAGSVDDGKSTLIGRLLFDSRALYDDHLEALERARVESGAPALDLAMLTDGLRAELTLMRASRAYAALQGKKSVTTEHLRHIAPLALRHRLRRNPLDDTGSGTRVQRALEEVLGA